MQLQPLPVLLRLSNQALTFLAASQFRDGCILLLIVIGPLVSHAADTIVNVNLAPAAELAKKLPGIGPAKAQAIVQYREQHGPFQSVDSLVNVKGIGPGILAKIQALVIVGSAKGDDAAQPLSQQAPVKTFAQQETAARHAVRAALNLASRHAERARKSAQ